MEIIEEINSKNDPFYYIEDQRGNIIFLASSPYEKCLYGDWVLTKKRGLIFVIICHIMGNNEDFYKLIVNQNIEKLKELKIDNFNFYTGRTDAK